ncbi:MAG: F0F1 ATP synthase subunit alpha [bacterium]
MGGSSVAIQADEITKILKERIQDFKPEAELKEVGEVLKVGDGVAVVYGLKNAMAGELLKFPNDVYGIAFNLETNAVGAVLFGGTEKVKEGDPVQLTGRIAEVPTGKELLGRVVNPLGEPLDGRGPLNASSRRRLEFKAPGVVARQPVKQPMQTGIKAIDGMVPIGRGQRELIIGDRQTGKTAVALDAILNQKGQDIICVYVAIGQKQSTVAHVVKTLKDKGALDYCIIVSATAADPAPLQYIAPYAGCAMAEEFTYNGGHALIVYDDLSKQAVAFRELSLLLRRPPGREAYPGDVFYLHSRLLERACKLSEKMGGGSLTALPIIETQAGDVTAYIPTNVISITDGQIFLESNLFYSGVRPAINVGISVSRVGGNAQTKATKKVAGKLRLDIAQYNELASFAQFGAELDKVSMAQLNRGARMVELLKQAQYSPMPMEEQVASLFAGTNGFLDDLTVDQVKPFEAGLLNFLKTKHAGLLTEIREKKDLSDEAKKKMTTAIGEFMGEFKK